MNPETDQFVGDLSPPIVQPTKKSRSTQPEFNTAYLDQLKKDKRAANKQRKEYEQLLAEQKEKKRLESAARQEHMQEVMDDITMNQLTIAKAQRKYSELNYQPGVLRRNLDSVRAGNGLAHKGPPRFFEGSEVSALRAKEIEKGLHKNSTNRNDAQETLNEYKRDVSFQRAEDLLGDRELVKGRKLQDMSLASFYRYKPQILGNTVKAYSQNAARSEALSCMYNALSLVAVMRAMNGYLFDTGRSGELHL